FNSQRGPHPRPFFYVQPPSQPYCLYQPWHFTNPYNHFGLPAGFNFGRPSLPPYPYVPYPGFVLPHAPIHPMDYRRMFEPRYQAWGDLPRQQYNPQPQGRRETACFGAQTDPSDAISKLIECLDKIRATELQSGDRELDSGVGSQSFGIFSAVEEKKTREQDQAPLPHRSCLESPGVTSIDSRAAVYDSESSRVILDPLSPEGGWMGRLEEELPLDSSSVHEECPHQPVPGEHFLSHETEEVSDIQSNVLVTDSSAQTRDAEKDQKTVPSIPPNQLGLSEAHNGDGPSSVLMAEGDMTTCSPTKADESYQIPTLPVDDVLRTAAPYYCNYLPMQTTHERMSVLSPSLDELSSRDEMFSTDLDDADLYPKHVYPGRRLSAVVGGSPTAYDEEDSWLPKRVVCACCGKKLEQGTSRRKVHSSKVYHDEAGDSEEEGKYGRGCDEPIRVVVRKHSGPRKAQPVHRHAAKPRYIKGQYKELSEPMKQEDSHKECHQAPAQAETEELELQCRTLEVNCILQLNYCKCICKQLVLQGEYR
uniref:Bucky ball n=1 Tax=Cyprinodon variegatus TaxID=28743 RepID=A0A3Q2CE56_CYPVA